MDAFAVVLTCLDRFSKEVEFNVAQEQEVVTQEAEGKSGNAWPSSCSCEEVKVASLR
jgi:hypothetical protein